MSTGHQDTQSNSDDSDDSQDATLVPCLLWTYKTSWNITSHFTGTVQTVGEHHTLHIHLDPPPKFVLWPHGFLQAATEESITNLAGECNNGLLGVGWYTLAYYTRHDTNAVSFDEFIAKKSDLPIITKITKCTLSIPTTKATLGCVVDSMTLHQHCCWHAGL